MSRPLTVPASHADASPARVTHPWRQPTPVLDSPAPVDERSPIHAELDRVGASFRKAGTANYISVQLGMDDVKLLGPPREYPRRSWLGPEWRILELLDTLPADAGTEAVWRLLEANWAS